jgi:D-ornithine 4,5-aminomutase subunit alpha
MERTDDFAQRRKHLAALSDEQLKQRFWELTAQVVEPLLELGRKNTTPSIERSVLLRMGIASMDCKTIVDGCIERRLMGKGAGHVVYKLSREKNISIKEAAAMLAAGKGWEIL